MSGNITKGRGLSVSVAIMHPLNLKYLNMKIIKNIKDIFDRKLYSELKIKNVVESGNRTRLACVKGKCHNH